MLLVVEIKCQQWCICFSPVINCLTYKPVMRIANLTLVGVVFSPTENYVSMDNVTKFTLLTGVHTLVRSSDDVKDVLQKNRDTF